MYWEVYLLYYVTLKSHLPYPKLPSSRFWLEIQLDMMNDDNGQRCIRIVFHIECISSNKAAQKCNSYYYNDRHHKNHQNYYSYNHQCSTRSRIRMWGCPSWWNTPARRAIPSASVIKCWSVTILFYSMNWRLGWITHLWYICIACHEIQMEDNH